MRAKYGGKAPVFAFDFKNKTTWQEYEGLCKDIQREVGEDKIALLVNNIEALDPRKGKVHKASDEELTETTNLNTFPMIMMSRFLGP